MEPEVCDDDYDDDDDDDASPHPSMLHSGGSLPHTEGAETMAMTMNHHMSSYQRGGKVLKSNRSKRGRGLRVMPAEVVETRRPKHFVLIADSIRRTYEQLIMEESRKAHFNSNPNDHDDGDHDDGGNGGSSIVVDDPSSSSVSAAVGSKEIAVIKNSHHHHHHHHHQHHEDDEELEKNRRLLYLRLPKKSSLDRAKVQLPTEVSNDRR